MHYNDEEFFETRYEGYFVSRSGKFLSKNRLGIKLHENIYTDGDGYKRPILSFVRDGKRIARRIHLHRIVAETFLGECPNGFVVDHIDHDKLNNSIDNLRYISNAENLRRSHVGIKPKMKIRCAVELDGNEHIFDSISKACSFLGMNRHQYNRIKSGAKRVKQYDVKSWKFENNAVFVCLTTNPDECRDVGGKRTALETVRGRF